MVFVDGYAMRAIGFRDAVSECAEAMCTVYGDAVSHHA
jgi:hypothetical protein